MILLLHPRPLLLRLLRLSRPLWRPLRRPLRPLLPLRLRQLRRLQPSRRCRHRRPSLTSQARPWVRLLSPLLSLRLRLPVMLPRTVTVRTARCNTFTNKLKSLIHTKLQGRKVRWHRYVKPVLDHSTYTFVSTIKDKIGRRRLRECSFGKLFISVYHSFISRYQAETHVMP